MEGLTNEVVLQYIEANAENEELKTVLSSKFTVEKEVEKIVEKEKEYTDEDLEKILTGKQSLNDKLEEKARKRQIAKALNKKVDELTADELKLEFIPKNSYDELNVKHENVLKEFAIKQVIGAEKFEEFKDIIDLNKVVKKDDGTYEGLEKLQALFGGLQTPKQTVKVPTSNPIKIDDKEAEKEAYLKKVGLR
jgi:hypothetical protein